MNISRCRSCRAPIVFLSNGKGGRVPVDADTLYLTGDEIAELDDDELLFDGTTHVSHFKTCPQAGQFSKRKQR